MNLRDFLDHLNRGESIEAGSEPHGFVPGAVQEARGVTVELNTG